MNNHGASNAKPASSNQPLPIARSYATLRQTTENAHLQHWRTLWASTKTASSLSSCEWKKIVRPAITSSLIEIRKRLNPRPSLTDKEKHARRRPLRDGTGPIHRGLSAGRRSLALTAASGADFSSTVAPDETDQEHDRKTPPRFRDQARGNGAQQRAVEVGEIEFMTSPHRSLLREV